MAKQGKDTEKIDLTGREQRNKLDVDHNRLSDTALKSAIEKERAQDRLNEKRKRELSDAQRLKEIEESRIDLNETIDSLLEEQNKLNGELLATNEKLEKLSSDSVDYEKEKAELQEKINTLTQSKFDLSLQEKTSQEELNHLEEQRNRILSDRKEPFNSSVQRTYRNIGDSMKSITDITQDMFNLDDRMAESKRDQNALQILQNDLVDQGFDTNSKTLNVIDLMRDSSSDLSDGFLTLGKNTESLGLESLKNVNLDEKRIQLAKLKSLLEDDEIKNNKELYSDLQRQLQLQEGYLKTLEKGTKTLETAQALSDTVIGGITSGFDAVNSGLSKLPGGALLGKALGLDQLESKIKTQVGGAMSDAFKSAGGGATGFLKATTSGLSSMGSMLMGPAGILLALTAIVAIGSKLVGMFLGADEAVSKMQESMEVSKDKAVELQGAATDIAGSINMVGVNSKEVMESMSGLREAFGGMRIDPTVNAEMKGLVEQTTLLSTKFGLSAQESKDLYSQSKILGVSMEELTATAATFGDKTIGSKEALKEMAKLPKSLTVGFKGTVQQLAAAAVKAKMMGTTLEKMKSIGEGMLDIESSLDAEMEARILTGKNIQLDAARELAMKGDVAGLQDEILNQMGSMEDFKKMDVMAQQSMAKAMGMSVDEMTEMLSKAEENKALGIDSVEMAKLQEASAEELNKLAEGATGENAKAYAEKLKGMAAEKESASLQEKMSNIMTKIQEKVQKLILPLVDMVHALFDSTDAAGGLMGAFDVVAGIIGSIFNVVGFLFKLLMKLSFPIQLVQAIFTEIMSAVKPLVDEVSKLFESTDKGGESVDYIGKAFEIIGSIVGGLASILAIAIVNPLKFVVGIITSIIKLFTGDFAGGVKGIGDSIKGFIFGPIEKIGEMFDNVFGTNISGAIKNITSLLDPVINIFSKLYGTYLLGIWEVIKSIGKAIFDYMMTPINTVMGIFSGIGQIINGDLMGGLQTIGQSILDYILAPFNLVIGIVTSIVDFIQSMVEKATSLGGTIGAVADTVGSVLGAIGFGGDDEEPASGSPVPAKAEGGPITSSTGYTLVGEQGPELVQLPNGSNVMTAEQTGGMMGGTGSPAQSTAPTGGSSFGGNDKVISLLEQILAVASQEVMVKLGDTFVQEVDSKIQLRSKMRVNMDSTWGNSI